MPRDNLIHRMHNSFFFVYSITIAKEQVDGQKTIYWEGDILSDGECLFIILFLQENTIKLGRKKKHEEPQTYFRVPASGLY